MKTRTLVLFILLIFAMALFAGVAYSAEPKKGVHLSIVEMPNGRYYFVGSVKIRSGPSISSAAIGQVFNNCYGTTNNDTVEYLGEMSNGWVKIKHPARGHKGCWPGEPVIGWVYGEFFGIRTTAEYVQFLPLRKYDVSVYNVTARSAASIRSNVKMVLEKGNIVTIVGRKGNWLKTDTGRWVFHELLTLQD